MGLLWDIARRLLMVAVFTLLFAGCWYLLDAVRQKEAVSLTELQKTVDMRWQVCSRLNRRLQQNYMELSAIPFYRADLRVMKEAEIRGFEVLYEEAKREFRSARQVLERSRNNAEKTTEVLGTKYLWGSLLTGLSVLVLMPVFLKILMFYLAARLAEKLPPVCLQEGKTAGPVIGFTSGAAALDVELQPGVPLFLRAGDWGKKRTGVAARTRLMWSWRYPVVTLAAGLCELVELTAESGKRAVVTVTSPDPDVFIGRIDLNGGSVVLRPRFLVGFSGDIQIHTRWNFHLHNILSCRVRQVILSGTGSLLVAGAWGVEAARPEAGQDWRIEDDLLFGYCTDAEFALCRTETFWHYFRGKTSLFDRRMLKGVFFTQNKSMTTAKSGGSFLERTVNALLNGIGSLLGF